MQTGWLNQLELNKYIANSDFGYVPYSFRKKRKHQMTHSFPSKIGFYVSNGLPIFFHGPHYSTVFKFIEDQRIGVSCTHQDIEEILISLEQILNKIQYKKNEIENRLISTYNMEFSNEVFLDKLLNSL